LFWCEYGPPHPATKTNQGDGEGGAGVGALLFGLERFLSDGTVDVGPVGNLNDGVGDALEIPFVVGAACAEFAADGPAGEVVQDAGNLELGGVPLALLG